MFRQHTLVRTLACPPFAAGEGANAPFKPLFWDKTQQWRAFSVISGRRKRMRIEIRTTLAEKLHWQKVAKNKGISLSELVRSLLGGQRLRKRREPPKVDPALLRELARIGNNLNQLARAANRHTPLSATAVLVRLIEIDRELAAVKAAHTVAANAD